MSSEEEKQIRKAELKKLEKEWTHYANCYWHIGNETFAGYTANIEKQEATYPASFRAEPEYAYICAERAFIKNLLQKWEAEGRPRLGPDGVGPMP